MAYRYDFKRRIIELNSHRKRLLYEKQKLLEKKRLFDLGLISSKDFANILNNVPFTKKLNEIEEELLLVSSKLKELRKKESKQKLKEKIEQIKKNPLKKHISFPKKGIGLSFLFFILLLVIFSFKYPGITGFFALNDTGNFSNLNLTINDSNNSVINEINKNSTNPIVNLTNNLTNTTPLKNNTQSNNSLNLNNSLTNNKTISTENETNKSIELEVNLTNITKTTDITNMTNMTKNYSNVLEKENYDLSFTLNKIINQNKLIMLENEKKQKIDSIIRKKYENKKQINLEIINTNEDLITIKPTTPKYTTLIFINYNAPPKNIVSLCWKNENIDSITFVSKNEKKGFVCGAGIGRLNEIKSFEVYEISSKKDIQNLRLFD